MLASRALRLIVLATATLTASLANATTPALVVDVDSGRVLHAERATDPWFPASVTKLMTAYVALEAVRNGRAQMDQLLTVSEEAASLPPSKMGFKPGTQVRLDNALKIIMVKSANDIAATIAEGIGGSVDGFAAMMNDAAQRLGMRESRFVNPHGLPDDRQQTSARDMAILGRALLRDFPEHKDFFQIGAIQFGRRVMRNHNGLIGRYPGADGMKTGFICASGFNVVASATRNGRRLLTVVLGSSSANERTLKAADLFDRGFESAGLFNPTLDQLPSSASATAPNMRGVICDRRGPLPAEEDGNGNVTANAANDATTISLFNSTGALAFTGTSEPTRRTTLGPRAPVQPVKVWVGLNPPSAAEEDAEEKEATPKAPKPKSLKRSKAAAATDASDAKLKALSAVEPKAIVEEGKGGKEAARSSVSLKPVSASKDQDAKNGAAANTKRSAAGANTDNGKKATKPASATTQADAQTKAASKPSAKN